MTEFRRIVRIGLGRAILVLSREDPTPYLDVIVEACLHNQAYDPQVEGVRVDYLLDLIRLSGNASACRERVLAALQSVSPDADHVLDQLFALAGAFAREGHVEARTAMYARFAAKASDRSLTQDAVDLGGEQIVRLDGVAGFLFVAEHLGRRILAGESMWVWDWWLRLAEEQSGTETVKQEVEKSRRENPAIDAYLNSTEVGQHTGDQAENRRAKPASLTYDEVKPLLGRGGRTMSYMGLRQWGQTANETSLLRAGQDLLHEQDPKRLLAYLRIFSGRTFPLAPPPLIRLAWSDDGNLSWAARLALGNVCHPLVREAALRFLADPTKRSLGIHVLAPNFEPGDHVLVERALTASQDSQDESFAYHTLGYDTLNLIEANPRLEFSASLLLLYERGPCSNCRRRCFDQLRVFDRLPSWLVEECRYDANLDLRERAASLGEGADCV